MTKTVTCDQCGKQTQKTNTEKTEKNFCSQECYIKYRNENTNKQKVTCYNCGKTFNKPKNRVEKTDGHFCSRECYNESVREGYLAEKRGEYKEKIKFRPWYKILYFPRKLQEKAGMDSRSIYEAERIPLETDEDDVVEFKIRFERKEKIPEYNNEKRERKQIEAAEKAINAFDLPEKITEDAETYFKEIKEKKGNYKGTSFKGWIAGTIAFSVKKHGYPLSFKEIKEKMESISLDDAILGKKDNPISIRDINIVYRKLKDKYFSDVEIKHSSSKRWMERILQELKDDEVVSEEEASEIYYKAISHLDEFEREEGVSCRSAAAGAVYYFGNSVNAGVTQKKVGEISDLTTVTVRKIKGLIDEHLRGDDDE